MTDVDELKKLQKEVERLSGLVEYLYEKIAYQHDNMLDIINFKLKYLWKERVVTYDYTQVECVCAL